MTLSAPPPTGRRRWNHPSRGNPAIRTWSSPPLRVALALTALSLVRGSDSSEMTGVFVSGSVIHRTIAPSSAEVLAAQGEAIQPMSRALRRAFGGWNRGGGNGDDGEGPAFGVGFDRDDDSIETGAGGIYGYGYPSQEKKKKTATGDYSGYGAGGSSAGGYNKRRDGSSSYGSSYGSSSYGSSSQYGNYGSSSSFKKPSSASARVSLLGVVLVFFLMFPASALFTAYAFEHHPEGTYANFCRLSLNSTRCVYRMVYNIYHCRLGALTRNLFTEDEEQYGKDYSDEELERMKARPGLESAMDAEHGKAMKRLNNVEMGKLHNGGGFSRYA